MDPELKAALDEQMTAWKAFQKANDERLAKIEAGDTKGVTELNAKIERINAALDEAGKKIEAAHQRASDLEGEMNILSLGGPGKPAKQNKEFLSYMRSGDESGFRGAATTQVDPDGGFLVPDNIRSDIERVATAYSPLRSLAAVQRISVGNSYVEFLTAEGANGAWVGETDSRPGTGTPKLVRIETPVREMYANPQASQNLLDDVAVNIEQWLADEVGVTFGELEAEAFISGDGVQKPRGILGYDTVSDSSYAWGKLGYVKTGNASAFPTTNPEDLLVDLTTALKRKYRQGAAFILNRKTLGVIRKFKNTMGYLWQPSMQAGMPSLLLGYPVYEDDYMPDVGADKFPIAFGDYRQAYRIVDHVGIRTLRDPYSNKPFISFYTTKRVGGGIRNFEALKLLKVEN